MLNLIIFSTLSLADVPESLLKVYLQSTNDESTGDTEEKDGNGQNGKKGENSQKGKVEGPVNGKQTGKMKWNKYKEEQDIIFRPEFGVTTLNLDSQDQSVGGAHLGISLGTEKTKRLKAANVGLYTRSRVYGMGSLGSDLNVYDFRAGSVMGLKVLHAEAEIGFDLLRHMADSGQTQGIDFQASNGFGIPAQALFVSDLFSVKIGAEPRWYFDGQPRGQENRAVDWSNHPSTESLPLAPIGDEFSWTVGFRSGWFGLSYEQLIMNGGSQHTVSFGLQR